LWGGDVKSQKMGKERDNTPQQAWFNEQGSLSSGGSKEVSPELSRRKALVNTRVEIQGEKVRGS